MIHEVKCWPEYFEAVLNGTKLFELRTADRDYRVGDTLWQREYEPGGRTVDLRTGEFSVKRYTGREVRNKITWILAAHPTLLPEGVCAMSLEPRDLALAGLEAEDERKAWKEKADRMAEAARACEEAYHDTGDVSFTELFAALAAYQAGTGAVDAKEGL